MKQRKTDGVPVRSQPEKHSAEEYLCMFSLICVFAALILFAALLFSESYAEFAWIADWVLAGAGMLAGLSGLLISAFTRPRTRPRRKVLLALTGIAVFLPPLVGYLFITAVINAM